MSDETLVRIRSIIANTSHQNLIDNGLKIALEKIVDRYNISEFLKIELEVSTELKGIDKSLEIILYKIIIELINNTIKHANASFVFIKINCDTVLKVSYSDNGIGFKYREVLRKSDGLGLRSIIDRVRLFQGNIQIKSAEAKGIKVEIKFPLLHL